MPRPGADNDGGHPGHRGGECDLTGAAEGGPPSASAPGARSAPPATSLLRRRKSLVEGLDKPPGCCYGGFFGGDAPANRHRQPAVACRVPWVLDMLRSSRYVI